MINLKLDIHCPCGHDFKIDPVGVQPWTDIVCPACASVEHIAQETIDDVLDELSGALADAYEDEDEYQNAIAFWYEATDKDRATVVDDGF